MRFTFRDVGTKQVVLTVVDARGRTSSVQRAVAVSAAAPAPTPAPTDTPTPAPTPPPSTRGTLTWAPPACGDATHGCVDLNLSNTGSNQTPSLKATNDYRIHLPSVPLQGGLQIRGGRNVTIIGGQINLTVPCSDASSACHGINIDKPTAGEVYIEGVWIHNPQTPITQSTGDGIDVANPATNPSDIVLQNVRIDGISGCSGGSDHADVYQPYAAGNANQYIDHLTGTTNCQGMQVDPDLAWDWDHTYSKQIIAKNTNITVLPNPFRGTGNRYAWWLTYGLECNSGPIRLENAYVSQPNGGLNGNSVWPDVDQPSACASRWSSPWLTFPNSPQISGMLIAGNPPGGDYVPLGTAGVGYVSPGYM
jgi:hypothetical protein